MPVLLAHGVERPHLRTPWVLLAAVTGAVLDLGVAVLFWAAEGVDPLRIPQSIAAWFVGRAAYDGDTSTALFGVLAYTALADRDAFSQLYAATRSRAWAIMWGEASPAKRMPMSSVTRAPMPVTATDRKINLTPYRFTTRAVSSAARSPTAA